MLQNKDGNIPSISPISGSRNEFPNSVTIYPSQNINNMKNTAEGSKGAKPNIDAPFPKPRN